MVSLVNRAKMGTATVGTGTITLASAINGYQSFADAGVVDSDTVSYAIEDGNDWEVGVGTYSASGPTLTRGASESSNAGSEISLSGSATVLVTALGADIMQPANNLSDLSSAATARTNLGLGTMAVETASDYAALSGATFSGTVTIQEVIENATVDASALTGTYNFDVLSGSVILNTTDASANWTLNIRGDSSNSLDSILSTGDSVTLAHITQQGATPYYASAVTIDGSSVTPKWQGGSAPAAGNASSLDVYVLSVIKTGAATFTVLAAQTQFA